jgi:hypothetical protein
LLLSTWDYGNTGSGGTLYGADQTINIAVNNVPVAPVAGNFLASVNEDTIGTVSGWNFTDANGDPAAGIVIKSGPSHGTLFVDVNSDNQLNAGEAVVLDTLISWNDAITAPKVKYLGNADFNGSDSLTYVVQDTTGLQGSTPAETGTVSMDVIAVNDAPVTLVPDPVTNPQSTPIGTSLTFSTANGNAITLGDVDAGTGTMWFRVIATNGTVSLSQTTDLTYFWRGTGTNDVRVSFDGTLASINAALNGMTFTPNAGFSGTASLLLSTWDYGNTGSGGTLYGADQTINIAVV